MKYKISLDKKTWEVEVKKNSPEEFEMTLDGKVYLGNLEKLKGQFSLLLEGKSLLFTGESRKSGQHLFRLEGRYYPVQIRGENEIPVEGKAMVNGTYKEASPMPGLVKEIRCSLDQQVSEGETLMILEAMKMEIEIKAQYAGKVEKIFPFTGGSVQEGDPLFQVKVKQNGKKL